MSVFFKFSAHFSIDVFPFELKKALSAKIGPLFGNSYGLRKKWGFEKMTFMIKVKYLLFENLKCSKWPICTCVKTKKALSAKFGPLFGLSYGLRQKMGF